MLFLTNAHVEAVQLELGEVLEIVAAALGDKAAGDFE